MMMRWVTGGCVALALCASAADARALKLKAAKDQPEDVKAGLSVEYAYPKDVKSLRDAYVALGVGAEAGPPLESMDYLSSEDAPLALTSNKETKVAARITGYLKFDEPGTYMMQVYSNDGLELTIGGREVAKVDEKRGCDPIGEAVEVRVRSAGWYELEALYWQRKGGSCLIMEWAPEGGELEPIPASAFGH